LAEPPVNLPTQGSGGRGVTSQGATAAVAVSAAFAETTATGAVATASATNPGAAQAQGRDTVLLEATRDAGASFFYALPCRAVDNCEPAQAHQLNRKLIARTLDGGALPDWLKFDTSTATFFGTAPNKTRQLKVRVSAAGAAQAGTVIVSLNFAGGKPSQ
jgi:hypothetical protein